mmetsp:Transcript_2863/g.3287  ORF Transcript_2863/g.3287 Transcript_2863/m.3287 type:complete len:110 (+) Transcript_2863:55-384(+)
MKTCRLCVRCSPIIIDPSEFCTILLLSIRSLFGELESHSIGLKVLPASASSDTEMYQKQTGNNDDSNYQFVVECYVNSINAIRASLTMITTPSYLQSKIYRFDIVNVES